MEIIKNETFVDALLDENRRGVRVRQKLFDTFKIGGIVENQIQHGRGSRLVAVQDGGYSFL